MDINTPTPRVIQFNMTPIQAAALHMIYDMASDLITHDLVNAITKSIRFNNWISAMLQKGLWLEHDATIVRDMFDNVSHQLTPAELSQFNLSLEPNEGNDDA